MKSQTLGTSTSIVEVTHIDSRSLWLYVDGKEYFMSFEDFPRIAALTSFAGWSCGEVQALEAKV